MLELSAGTAGAVGTPEMLGDLGLALLLSTAIGLERELRAKSAGLRTHTLVGLGAALFMLVSKFGFADVLAPGQVALDPSRIAAQVVSGIGFVGGGLIFVRRDVVRGLTTAASVWLVAAVGMAAGAGLVPVSVAATGAYFVIALAYAPAENLLYRLRGGPLTLRVAYRDGHGVLRRALEKCTDSGFLVVSLQVEHEDTDEDGMPAAMVLLGVRGKHPTADLLGDIAGLEGVLHVAANVPTGEPEPPDVPDVPGERTGPV